MFRTKSFGFIALFSISVIIVLALAGNIQTFPALGGNLRLVQSTLPTLPVLPENLTRIS